MKLIVYASAEADILRQFEWYANHASFSIAIRFRDAVRSAMTAMPGAGTPRHIENALLADLRTWPISGFDKFRLYYLAQDKAVAVLRILHGSRDIGRILGEE